MTTPEPVVLAVEAGQSREDFGKASDETDEVKRPQCGHNRGPGDGEDPPRHRVPRSRRRLPAPGGRVRAAAIPPKYKTRRSAQRSASRLIDTSCGGAKRVGARAGQPRGGESLVQRRFTTRLTGVGSRAPGRPPRGSGSPEVRLRTSRSRGPPLRVRARSRLVARRRAEAVHASKQAHRANQASAACWMSPNESPSDSWSST